MNQLLIAGIGAVVLFGGGLATGWKVNNWRHDSQDLAISEAAEKAGTAATDAAVAAIKNNRPIYQTINKGIEKEFRSEVRYTSPDCSHTPESWRLLDSAYQTAGGEPFSSGTGVPAPTAATGSNIRGNN